VPVLKWRWIAVTAVAVAAVTGGLLWLFLAWSGRPEAELMLEAWPGGPDRVLCDNGARVTAETAVHVAHLAQELGAEEVVAVTSWWHCRRTGVLFRRALSGTGIDVRTFGAPRWSGRLLLREAAAYAVLPLHLRKARV